MSRDKQTLVDMYRIMVRIRLFEERVGKEFAAGNIPGFVHIYSGQEAAAVGIADANWRSVILFSGKGSRTTIECIGVAVISTSLTEARLFKENGWLMRITQSIKKLFMNRSSHLFWLSPPYRCPHPL